jgi:hypothetical protein
MDTLKFAIVDNPITPDPNDGMAIIVNQNTVDMEQIEQEILVPALQNGAYRIEARVILPKTKNLRTGGLDDLIEV